MKKNNNYEVNETTISVCAWCYPGDTVFQFNPHLRGLGLKVSHGICGFHRAEHLAGLQLIASKVPSLLTLASV